MKLTKVLTSLAVVAAGLMAFAAGASATTITAPAGTAYTGTIKASAEGHAVLDNPIAKIECASTVEGKVEKHGSGINAAGKISSLTFGSPVGTCTNSWHVTVVSPGEITIQVISPGVGTVFVHGSTVEATRFGITCRYATSGTHIGTLTGSIFGGSPTFHILGEIPFHSGSGLCGSGATTWTGSYVITSPSTLTID